MSFSPSFQLNLHISNILSPTYLLAVPGLPSSLPQTLIRSALFLMITSSPSTCHWCHHPTPYHFHVFNDLPSTRHSAGDTTMNMTEAQISPNLFIRPPQFSHSNLTMASACHWALWVFCLPSLKTLCSSSMELAAVPKYAMFSLAPLLWHRLLSRKSLPYHESSYSSFKFLFIPHLLSALIFDSPRQVLMDSSLKLPLYCINNFIISIISVSFH